MVEWHRQCHQQREMEGGTDAGQRRPQPLSCPEEENDEVGPSDAVDEHAERDVAAAEETDLLTHPLLRELLLLLLTTLETAQAWAPIADLVREMIRQDATLVLTDLYWYAQSLLVSMPHIRGLAFLLYYHMLTRHAFINQTGR